MVEVVAIIACAIVAIVILTYIKDLLEGKRKKIKATKKESVRMQADIDELKIECSRHRKKVAEMQDQIAELYIQQDARR